MAAAKGAKQRAQAPGCTRWSAALDSLQHLQNAWCAQHVRARLLTEYRPVSFSLARCMPSMCPEMCTLTQEVSAGGAAAKVT